MIADAASDSEYDLAGALVELGGIREAALGVPLLRKEDRCLVLSALAGGECSPFTDKANRAVRTSPLKR